MLSIWGPRKATAETNAVKNDTAMNISGELGSSEILDSRVTVAVSPKKSKVAIPSIFGAPKTESSSSPVLSAISIRKKKVSIPATFAAASSKVQEPEANQAIADEMKGNSISTVEQESVKETPILAANISGTPMKKKKKLAIPAAFASGSSTPAAGYQYRVSAGNAKPRRSQTSQLEDDSSKCTDQPDIKETPTVEAAKPNVAQSDINAKKDNSMTSTEQDLIKETSAAPVVPTKEKIVDVEPEVASQKDASSSAASAQEVIRETPAAAAKPAKKKLAIPAAFASGASKITVGYQYNVPVSGGTKPTKKKLAIPATFAVNTLKPEVDSSSTELKNNKETSSGTVDGGVKPKKKLVIPSTFAAKTIKPEDDSSKLSSTEQSYIKETTSAAEPFGAKPKKKLVIPTTFGAKTAKPEDDGSKSSIDQKDIEEAPPVASPIVSPAKKTLKIPGAFAAAKSGERQVVAFPTRRPSRGALSETTIPKSQAEPKFDDDASEMSKTVKETAPLSAATKAKKKLAIPAAFAGAPSRSEEVVAPTPPPPRRKKLLKIPAAFGN